MLVILLCKADFSSHPFRVVGLRREKDNNPRRAANCALDLPLPCWSAWHKIFYIHPQVDAACAQFFDNTLFFVCVCSAVTNKEMATRSEEHTSELQSRIHLVCRLLL